jgi:hypothetical protein
VGGEADLLARVLYGEADVLGARNLFQ